MTPPTRPMSSATAGARAALWLGPDEWLLIAEESARDLMNYLELALGGIFHSLVDISHRQVGIWLEGPGAARLLGAGCPLDLDLRAFPVGMSTRSAARERRKSASGALPRTAFTSKCCAPLRPMSRASSMRRRGTRAEAGARPRRGLDGDEPERRRAGGGNARRLAAAGGGKLLRAVSRARRRRPAVPAARRAARCGRAARSLPPAGGAMARSGRRRHAAGLDADRRPARQRSRNLAAVRRGEGGDPLAEFGSARASRRRPARRFRARRLCACARRRDCGFRALWRSIRTRRCCG